MLDKVYDIFLSYNHKDKEIVTDIFKILDLLDLKVFLDIEEHSTYAPEEMINEALQKSRCFVLVGTENSSSGGTEYESNFISKFKSKTKNDGPQTPSVVILKTNPLAKIPPSIKKISSREIECDPSILSGIMELFITISQLKKEDLEFNGIIKFFMNRHHIPKDFWDLLYKYSKSVKLLGHSIARPFSDNTSKSIILNSIIKNNSVYEVIQLNPGYPINDQLNEIELQEKKSSIAEKNNVAIEALRKIKQELQSSNKENNIQIRLVDKIIYSNIAIFDKLAIITHYARIEEPGDESPAQIIIDNGHKLNSLYKFYLNQFEKYWVSGIHPEMQYKNNNYGDIQRIYSHISQVSNIKNWLGDKNSKLPLPAQLIIYPTYSCSWEGKPLCSNCAYKQKIVTNNELIEIPFDLLKRIIYDGIQSGILRYEFSGGGEPTLYTKFEQLTDELINIRSSNQEVRFGLFTNGINIRQSDYQKISDIFNYIRFDFAEAFLNNEELRIQFLKSLKDYSTSILEKTTTPYLGVKFLLSKGNTDKLIESISFMKEYLNDNFQRINHLRIKSLRSKNKSKEPTESDFTEFNYKFFERVFIEREDWPDDIQVDLDLRYLEGERNYTCYLNPAYAVVDPTGSLMMCLNYLNDYENLKLGDLRTKSIIDLWGTKDHKTKISRIDPKKVCNASNGCPCRFASYQKIVENKFDSKYRNFKQV